MLIHQYTDYVDWTPDWFMKFDQEVRKCGAGITLAVFAFNGIMSWMIWGLAGAPADSSDSFNAPWALSHQIVWTFLPVLIAFVYLVIRRVFVVAWYGTYVARDIGSKFYQIAPEDQKQLKPVYKHVMRNSRRGVKTDLAVKQQKALERAVDRAFALQAKNTGPDPLISRAEQFIAVLDEMERRAEIDSL